MSVKEKSIQFCVCKMQANEQMSKKFDDEKHPVSFLPDNYVKASTAISVLLIHLTYTEDETERERKTI